MSKITKAEWHYWCATWDTSDYRPQVEKDIRTTLSCVEQLVANEIVFTYEQRQMLFTTLHVTIVNLWLELQQRRAHKCTLPDSVDQALNEGDGVYRP